MSAAKARIPAPAEQVLPQAENLFKAFFLLSSLAASFMLAGYAGETLVSSAVLSVRVAGGLMIGLLAIANVILLTGMGILAHDAVHRVLFRSAFWNEFWGGVLSAFALIPFNANRQFHLTHHSYAHQPGMDPENAMHHHSFFYAATAGSALALLAQYGVMVRNFRHAAQRRHAVRIARDVLCLTAVFAIYFVGLPLCGISVWHSIVPTLAVFPMVFAFRALSDHYGVPPVTREAGSRKDVLDVGAPELVRSRREVSGWVVLTAPWLEWLWSHVNYHEVHHQYPYLSHRYLPEVFAATRSQHPYLVVRGYWRSLWNLRRLRYYSESADVQAFRCTDLDR